MRGRGIATLPALKVSSSDGGDDADDEEDDRDSYDDDDGDVGLCVALYVRTLDKRTPLGRVTIQTCSSCREFPLAPSIL